MTLRNRALLLVGILGIISSATAGCELIADFDRSKIDGGTTQVADSEAPDSGTPETDSAPPADAGSDTSLPPDGGEDAAEDSANDTGNDTGTDANDGAIADSGPDAADAGCTGASGCPVGEACNLTSHLCTTACTASQPCNGTCCSGTTCQQTESPTACGAGGTVCASCTAADAGTTCVAGACGCNNADDCAVGEACSASHVCTTACSGSEACHGGCCGSGGTCVTGTADDACGASGTTCGTCAGDSVGTKCVVITNGGACGCAGPGDCTASGDAGASCSATGTPRQCTTACSASQACTGSCCNIPNGSSTGTCGGGTPGACGAAGALCLDCSTSTNGHVCSGTACGCVTANDCPANNACTGGKCTTSCATDPCNTGCCDSTKTCVGGTSALACGTGGGSCDTCGPTGSSCLVVTGGGTCGCTNSTQCPSGKACDTNNDATKNTCTTTCSGTDVCNGTCCNLGTCAADDTQAASCGAAGGACSDCTGAANGHVCVASACGCSNSSECGANEACENGKCSSDCSTNPVCNGGCCDSAHTCVAGTADPASCGKPGTACADCTASAVGTACVGSACGCTQNSECSVCATGSCKCDVPTNACVDTSITSFSATPTKIDVGGSSTLAWTVVNGTSCTLSDGSGPQSVACTGNQIVSPTVNTTYTLTANGADGQLTTMNASVTFNAPTIQTFTASATCADPPATDTFTWTSTNGLTAVLQDFTGATKNSELTESPNGNDTAASFTTPTATCGDTITLVVTGPGGTATQSLPYN